MQTPVWRSAESAAYDTVRHEKGSRRQWRRRRTRAPSSCRHQVVATQPRCHRQSQIPTSPSAGVVASQRQISPPLTHVTFVLIYTRTLTSPPIPKLSVSVPVARQTSCPSPTRVPTTRAMFPTPHTSTAPTTCMLTFMTPVHHRQQAALHNLLQHKNPIHQARPLPARLQFRDRPRRRQSLNQAELESRTCAMTTAKHSVSTPT